jgi:hypothetical protein
MEKNLICIHRKGSDESQNCILEKRNLIQNKVVIDKLRNKNIKA